MTDESPFLTDDVVEIAARRFAAFNDAFVGTRGPDLRERMRSALGEVLPILADAFAAENALLATASPSNRRPGAPEAPETENDPLPSPPSAGDQGDPSVDVSITGLIAHARNLRALEGFGVAASRAIKEAAKAFDLLALQKRKGRFDAGPTVNLAPATSKQLSLVIYRTPPKPGDLFRVEGVEVSAEGANLVHLMPILEIEAPWPTPSASIVTVKALEAIQKGTELVQRGRDAISQFRERGAKLTEAEDRAVIRVVEPLFDGTLGSEPYRSEPTKRWPFLESPGEFAKRLGKAFFYFKGDAESSMLAAVRTVLIEEPPTLADWALSVLESSKGEVAFLDEVGNEWTINRNGLSGDGDAYWELEKDAVILSRDEYEELKKGPENKGEMIFKVTVVPLDGDGLFSNGRPIL